MRPKRPKRPKQPLREEQALQVELLTWSDERTQSNQRIRDDQESRALPVVSPANMVPVQVVAREEIAPDVVSVRIVLPGTRQAPAPYLPGQFVTLALPTQRETLYRSYSLCGDGSSAHPWELTIKRMERGAVSTYFYDEVEVGTLLYASLPRGTFTLPASVGPELSLVLIAMGSGITPIMGMLRALAQLPVGEQPLTQLHYASRSPEEIIFGDELYEMDPEQTWLRQRHYLSSEGARMSVEAILARAGPRAAKAHWYVCGAESLKRELHARLAKLKVPESQIHSEIFATQSGPGARGPAYRITRHAGTGQPGSLRVIETAAVLDVQPNETLLTALERHGYQPDFSCRVGACGTCKLRVVEGQAEPAGDMLSEAERSAGYVLSCLARPIGEVALASGGRPPAGVQRVALPGRTGVSRAGAVTLTRFASIVGLSALVLGAWQLTDHRPASWGTPPDASASQSTEATDGATPDTSNAAPTSTTLPGQPTSTPRPGQPTPTIAAGQPTATLRPGQPTPTPAPPTPTPKPGQPTATPTPKPAPQPTATATPSK
jgi:ferredoxin-NADP reductase